MAHVRCCGTVKEGGSRLGCSHGRTPGLGRGLGWTRFPRAAECNQGLYSGTSGNSGRESATSGLLLGRAVPKVALCLGYGPLPFPPSHGHHAQGPAPVLQHPGRVEEQRDPGWSREVTCSLQLEYSLTSAALFLLPASGLMSRPYPSVWLPMLALLWVPQWCFGMCMGQLQPWNLQRNVRAEPCPGPEENTVPSQGPLCGCVHTVGAAEGRGYPGASTASCQVWVLSGWPRG